MKRRVLLAVPVLAALALLAMAALDTRLLAGGDGVAVDLGRRSDQRPARRAGPTSPGVQSPAEARRPNLIVIVTDDQAHWTLGSYGNTDSRTSQIDRLAVDGVRFANVFTPSPVCSPSRATMLSGRYGTEVGITDWISPLENEAGVGLPPETTTWAEALQRAGYRTGLIGKWHLGAKPEFHPTRHGYGHFVGFLAGGTTPMNPRLEENGVDREFPGAEPDVITDAALAFLDREAGRPFALSVHYRAPHTPYGPVPEQDLAPFRDAAVAIPVFPGLDQAQVRQWTREYYASIHSIDRNVGRLLDTLQRTGLDQRTVVIFTSDHGYNIGHHGLHTKGNGTWIVGGVNGPTMPNMFDTSLRPPLLVRGPGVLGGPVGRGTSDGGGSDRGAAGRGASLRRPSQGRAVNEMVSFEDLYPTLLSLAGVPMPADAPRHGRDLSPLLRGETVPQWRDAVYGQYDIHHYAIAHLRMIRETRWKLVRSYGTTTKDQLFDLQADPGELRNLWGAPDQRERRRALEGRLREWMRSIDDPLLKERGLLFQPAR